MNGHRLRFYVKKGIKTLRYEGPHTLALRVAKLASRPFGTPEISSCCYKDLTAPVVAPDARVRIDIARLSDGDVARLAPVIIEANRMARGPAGRMDLESAEKHVRKRLEAGAVCFVASYEDELIHYNWIFPGMPWQISRLLSFVPATSTEALLDDAFTLEKWRGNGIHGAVHARMLQFLQRSGYTRSYTNVDIGNRSSRKALNQLGYTCFSTVILFEARWSGRKRMVRIGRPLTQFRVGS